MPDEPSITGAVLSRLGLSAQSIQKIKFGRGVVGKVSMVAAIAILGITAIGMRLSGNAALLLGIGAIVLVVVAMLIGIMVVALKRPEMAVMEGMELVHYRHLTVGAKDFQPNNELPPVPDPGLPNLSVGENG